ncbi:DUF2206 domain-containing protein [Chloroflexota bacterium]
MQKGLTAKRLYLYILLLLAATVVAILLDIPILRQLLGFFFFTIVPGLLILHCLKLNKLGLAETIVLSVGLSITCLMFFGLFVDRLFFIASYTAPLSTKPLVLSFGVLVIILDIIAYHRNKSVSFFYLNITLDNTSKAFLLLPSLLPILSILGMHLMNSTSNNSILMLMLFIIPAYIILIVILRHKVPQQVYLPLIYFISISIVLMWALRGNHIIGIDSHQEYQFFMSIYNAKQWSLPSIEDPVSSCLSVTILPVVYQSFMNMRVEQLFRILYPLLFSISPLVIFLIARKYVVSSYAMLASFLFMSQDSFLITSAAARTNTAILFFALSILVLFLSNINIQNKRTLFILFAFSIIVSHYTTTYIFLVIYFIAWIVMKILTAITQGRSVAVVNSDILSKTESASGIPTDTVDNAASKLAQIHVITGNMLQMLLVAIFLWYSIITYSAFSAGIHWINKVFITLKHFWLLESRGGGIEALMGRGIPSLIPIRIELATSWLIIAFISIGVLTLVARFKNVLSTPNLCHKMPNWLRSKIDIEYFSLAIAAAILLTVCVIIPDAIYSINRLFFQMIVLLSLPCIIGGVVLANWVRIRPRLIMVTFGVILFFMCVTGSIYQVFDYPKNILLNAEGSHYDNLYIYDQDVYAARWLAENGIIEMERKICTDYFGNNVLISQGLISFYTISNVQIFWAGPIEYPNLGSYIYLRYFNVVKQTITARTGFYFPIEKYGQLFYEVTDPDAGLAWSYYTNKVYNNGGSAIWR